MKLELREYNVTANIDEMEEFNIKFMNNQILYNNLVINDVDKIKSVIDLIDEYKKEIIILNKKEFEIYKGGRQGVIRIKFNNDDKIYMIFENTSSTESSTLYVTIKDKLINIIEG